MNTLRGNGQWYLLRIYMTEVIDIIYKLSIYSLNWKLYSGKDVFKNKGAWHKIQLSKYYTLLWMHIVRSSVKKKQYLGPILLIEA
jgi:hypothetical protein